jgi:hypothetical protein
MTETQPNDDPPSPDDRTSEVAGAAAPGRPTLPATVAAWTIGAGLLAGLIAWAAGERLCVAFLPPVTMLQGEGGTRAFFTLQDLATADTRNATLCFAVLGGALGAGLGAAGGLSRKNGRSAASAALVGLIAGAAVSAGITALLLPPYYAYQMRTPDRELRGLFLPLFVHIGLWAPAGAAAGWAFARGLAPRGGTPAIVLGGLLGAAGGALVYEFVAALAFPLEETHHVISDSPWTRLLARVAVTTLAAAGVSLGAALASTTLWEAPGLGEEPRRDDAARGA